MSIIMLVFIRFMFPFKYFCLGFLLSAPFILFSFFPSYPCDDELGVVLTGNSVVPQRETNLKWLKFPVCFSFLYAYFCAGSRDRPLNIDKFPVHEERERERCMHLSFHD